MFLSLCRTERLSLYSVSGFVYQNNCQLQSGRARPRPQTRVHHGRKSRGTLLPVVSYRGTLQENDDIHPARHPAMDVFIERNAWSLSAPPPRPPWMPRAVVSRPPATRLRHFPPENQRGLDVTFSLSPSLCRQIDDGEGSIRTRLSRKACVLPAQVSFLSLVAETHANGPPGFASLPLPLYQPVLQVCYLSVSVLRLRKPREATSYEDLHCSHSPLSRGDRRQLVHEEEAEDSSFLE